MSRRVTNFKHEHHFQRELPWNFPQINDSSLFPGASLALGIWFFQVQLHESYYIHFLRKTIFFQNLLIKLYYLAFTHVDLSTLCEKIVCVKEGKINNFFKRSCRKAVILHYFTHVIYIKVNSNKVASYSSWIFQNGYMTLKITFSL